MNKILIFGSTGKLGTKVAIDLQNKNYTVTAVVRNSAKADSIKKFVNATLIADVTKPEQLKNICNGFDIVISTLGKSTSLNDKSTPGFSDIDLHANTNILQEAISSNVKKFVYVSVFTAEHNTHLNYFNTHHLFSQKLIASGLDYTILKPTAIMSAFVDLMEMAKKGQLLTMGNGDKHSNPIYESDLAQILVNSISQKNAVIDVGGKTVYTRKQINELLQQHAAPNKKLKSIPFALIKMGLPLIKLLDKNMFDKFAFYVRVMEDDLVAPKLGDTSLEIYLRDKLYL